MATTTDNRITEVDAATLDRWLKAGEAIVIDVREPVEHRAEHIAGAKLMPLSTFGAAAVPKGDGKKVVLHCRGGGRSGKAAGTLVSAGWSQAIHLQGGLEAWKAAGLPVEKDAAAPKLDLMRQTQIAIGSFVLVWVGLGAFVSPWFLGLAAFMGAGLVVAGMTGTCGMAMLIAKMPWNRKR